MAETFRFDLGLFVRRVYRNAFACSLVSFWDSVLDCLVVWLSGKRAGEGLAE